MKRLIVFVFVLTVCFSDESTVIFVSPPRTGTNWFKYSIEGITNRYVSFWHRFHSSEPFVVPDETFYGTHHIDKSKSPILHTHYPYHHLNAYVHKGHKLILIIRNHKEYLLRRAKEKTKDKDEIIKKITTPFLVHQYMQYFKFYEAWEDDKRLLIHYEDLVNDFETVIKKVLDFIGEDDARLDRFVANIDYHKDKVMKIYNRIYRKDGGAISGGKDVLFHSKDIPLPILHQIDSLIEKKYPHYWNAYLKRYKTL